MKMKIFILFVLQMFSFCSFAQNSDTEFFKEGKVWRGWLTFYWDYPYQDFSVQVCGDTIFNDIKCKKLIYKRYRLNTQEVTFKQIFVGYEKDKQVFVSYTGMGHHDFSKVLDFNLTLGKAESYDVLEIDTIQVNGIKRKRLKVSNSPEHVSYIVEGIGFNNDGDWGYIFNSFYNVILSVYEDGKCIFTKDDFMAPPITGIVNVKDTHSPEDNAIYNLMGKRVDAPIKGQIYIRNHKKFVVK